MITYERLNVYFIAPKALFIGVAVFWALGGHLWRFSVSTIFKGPENGTDVESAVDVVVGRDGD